MKKVLLLAMFLNGSMALAALVAKDLGAILYYNTKINYYGYPSQTNNYDAQNSQSCDTKISQGAPAGYYLYSKQKVLTQVGYQKVWYGYSNIEYFQMNLTCGATYSNSACIFNGQVLNDGTSVTTSVTDRVDCVVRRTKNTCVIGKMQATILSETPIAGCIPR